jgi:hypothetical protein
VSLIFSDHPGPNERQLKRKFTSSIFNIDNELDQSIINHAVETDTKLFSEYLTDFQSLVQEAVNLEASTDSEIILSIKERLDKSYTLCSALPGDNSEIKDAINKLLRVIMTAVRKGASNDPIALEKLDEEDLARKMHQDLQQNLLVVDLMLDDSPVAEDELTATLLSETDTNLEQALFLFDATQLELIFHEAREKVAQLAAKNIDPVDYSKKLKLIESAMLEHAEEKDD